MGAEHDAWNRSMKQLERAQRDEEGMADAYNVRLQMTPIWRWIKRMDLRYAIKRHRDLAAMYAAMKTREPNE